MSGSDRAVSLIGLFNPIFYWVEPGKSLMGIYYLVRTEGYLVGPSLSGIKNQTRSKENLGGSDVEGYGVCISIISLLAMQLSH